MASGQMPRIDMEKEISKFSERDQFFIKKVTEMNKTRAMNRFLIQHRNKWTAGLIVSCVLGICILVTWSRLVKSLYEIVLCSEWFIR